MVLELILQAATAASDPVREWTDIAVRYAFTGLVGYAVASVQFGKKLQAHEQKVLNKLEEDRRASDEKFAALEREQQNLANEVWGTQGDGGLRKTVERVQHDVSKLQTTSAEILTTVRLLAKNSTTGGTP